MHREYQHLKMIECSGRTFETMKHIPLGKGDIALECPACPHPGKNLPVDWELQIDLYVCIARLNLIPFWLEESNRWIYTLFVMLDANFCLKSRLCEIIDDLKLGDGLSYYVQSEPYKEHLKTIYKENDVSQQKLHANRRLNNFKD